MNDRTTDPKSAETHDCAEAHDSAEALSALVDGEGGASAVLEAVATGRQASIYADWNSYQAIGDGLRTPRAALTAGVGADPAFVQRLMLRLASETVAQAAPVVLVPGATVQHAVAANDASFRWKLLAGFASFSAVAALGWTLAGAPAGPEQLAATSARTERVVASPEGPVVRDARLEEFLSAHKQVGGTSLQVPPGFLRNAGFELAAGDRR